MKQTILLTGATDGIGLATAEMLLQQSQDHSLLLHGRNQQKLEDVAQKLSSQFKDADIETYVADLSHIPDVQELASVISEKHKKLDVLINNAGVLKTPKIITKDNLDIRFVVNTLAPFLLTQLLLPIIPNTGRVVNLSSAAQASVDIEALKGNVQLDDMAAYSQSKLAITMWSRLMASQLENGPTIVAVNPGSLLASKMVKDGFGVEGHDINIGADILTRASLSDEFNDASGKYYDNDAKQFAAPHDDALDDKKAFEVVKAIQTILNGLIG